jgi:hypothetical protein
MPGPADLGQCATLPGSSPPSPGPWATSESQRRSVASQRCNDLGFEAASHRDVEMFLGLRTDASVGVDGVRDRDRGSISSERRG